MKTTNIVFNKLYNLDSHNLECATMQGVGVKSIILMLVCFVAACCSIVFLNAASAESYLIYFVSIIATVVLQIIININPLIASKLSIPYVICEGFTIGVLCDLAELALPGEGFALAAGALMITLGIVLACSILYSNTKIRATSKFMKIMLIILTGTLIGSAFFSIFGLIINLTSGVNIFTIYFNSNLSILVSIVMIVIASIYLFISIQQAEQAVSYGIDKKYEWYAAFGIVITSIWLFLEIFALLIKFTRRRD